MRKILNEYLILAISVVIVVAIVVVLHFTGYLGRLIDSRGFDVVTLALAGVAIAFATIQFLDAQKHSRRLEDISGSVSTRCIGRFPKELGEIIEVVKKAKSNDEILIMCDFPDYGGYSDPDTCEKLRDALTEACQRSAVVRMLVYNAEVGKKISGQQFQNFEEMKKSSTFKRYREKYCGEPDFTNVDSFMSMIAKMEKKFREDVEMKGVKIGELSQQVWLFFWVETDEEAVFTFGDASSDDPGLAFRTRDVRLVRIFKSIFDDKWNKAVGSKEKPDGLAAASDVAKAAAAATHSDQAVAVSKK